MPGYSGSYAAPRLDLGEAMYEYLINPGETFIATKVLPLFATPKQKASFSKISREALLRRSDVKRAKRAAYNRDQYEAEDDNYECEEYGHEQPLDDSERAFYESDFDSELAAAKVAMLRLLIEQELRVSAAIFNTSTWTGAPLTTAVGATWATASTAIVKDIIDAKEKVRALTGLDPNALIISQKALNYMIYNTQIRESFSFTQVPTVDLLLNGLPQILGLRKVLVGKGVYNAAKEGQAYSGTDIWDTTKAMVAVIPEEGASLMEPGVGRSFLWKSDSPEAVMVEEYREEQTRSNIYRVRQNIDEKVFDASYGHLLTGI